MHLLLLFSLKELIISCYCFCFHWSAFWNICACCNEVLFIAVCIGWSHVKITRYASWRYLIHICQSLCLLIKNISFIRRPLDLLIRNISFIWQPLDLPIKDISFVFFILVSIGKYFIHMTTTRFAESIASPRIDDKAPSRLMIWVLALGE